MKKKSLTGIMTAGLAALMLAGCSSQGGQETTAASAESTAQSQEFSAASVEETGVKTELLSMSSGEVRSKIKAEGGTPMADLWFGGGIDAFMGAKEDGLLEQVNFDEAANLAPEYKDADNYWFAKGLTVVGFVVNNDIIEEKGLEIPKSWADLTNTAYQGEIIMSNPAISRTNYAVVNAILQAKGEEEGWNYFEEQNMTAVYPEDGIPYVPEGVAVFKNSEGAEEAKEFIEWFYSDDENLKMVADIDNKDTIKMVKPDIEGLELTFDVESLMDEDLSLFGSQRETILAKWDELAGDKSENE